jgi:hypothetical protein
MIVYIIRDPNQPVAAFGDTSILVGDLPIEFVWSSKGQVIESLQNEQTATILSSEKMRSPEKENNKTTGMQKGKRIKSWAGKTPGPAHSGISIQDLFQHSYLPPARVKPKNPEPRTSRWLWVPAARVWDPAAEKHPASSEDIKRFGASARFLRRVKEQTIDERSFVEVAKQDMDRKQLNRDFQDGHVNRANFQGADRERGDSRGGFQGGARDGC